MKEHRKRRIEIAQGIIPEKGTPEYEKMISSHKMMNEINPTIKKVIQEKYEKASKTGYVQNNNGIGLSMDKEIRHYLREFNGRLVKFGLRSMPMMFNLIEAFFTYDKSIMYFELLEEEDYLLSLADFFKHYTSEAFDIETESILDNLEEDIIFNYNIGADIKETTFKSEDGKEFVIGGVSIVRHVNEVTVLFLAGEVIDTEKITESLEEIPPSNVPGKIGIDPDKNVKLEAVQLNNNPNLWKTFVGCRFDLVQKVIDGKYVAKDIGKAFKVMTDELDAFINQTGEFKDANHEELFKEQIKGLDSYQPIFELAKAVLFLPTYYNTFEDKIICEEHDTKYKESVNTPLKRRELKNVENRFKIFTKTLWVLNQNGKFSPNRLVIRDDKFKVEKSGFWKKLNVDEIGENKNGEQITGKTWVNRKETYFEAKTDDLIISDKTKKEYDGQNSGYIYMMRNAYLPKNTFKIGLTTNSPDERAKQLSKTSIPDQYMVMNEWNVADCRKAEKEIHQILDNYRDDPRREFFTAESKIIFAAIQKVVDNINKDFNSAN
ncbi:GIY-YIG nuclease family protein [Pedobacter gandavensis]|uniref:GIY-YIG nuclease family protein n=1 Tax=Pedobacter gandavensis TaxID=2679963 RepID=UPI0029303AB1|nr:GIY-YIG nuclease family protein [Pedobacter gandavensis]